MAYADLPAKSAGDTITLSNYDQIADNFDACAVDNFTTLGDLFVGTGADAGARLGVGADDSILVADSGEATGLAWQIQPAAIVNNSGAFDPTPDSWVTVTWDSEGVDTDGMHSTGSNTSRLTVPTNGDGLYLVMANIQFDTTSLAAGTGVGLGVRLLVDGTTVYRRLIEEVEVPAFGDVAYCVSGIITLNATHYIEVQVYTTEDIDVTNNSRFEAMWMRRQ